MFKFLKKLFSRKTEKEGQLELPAGMDPNIAETIRKCFETGKPVRGYYDDNGKYITEVLEPEEFEDVMTSPGPKESN